MSQGEFCIYSIGTENKNHIGGLHELKKAIYLVFGDFTLCIWNRFIYQG